MLAQAATPFMMIGLLGVLLGEINTLMLMWWGNAEQTGLFQPLARITPLLMLSMQAISVRYAPRITETLDGGRKPRDSRT